MKEKDILEVIGGIDEEMILDAAPSEKQKKRMPWGRMGTAAACAALVLAGALAAAPYLDSGDPTQTTTDLTYIETSTEIGTAENRYAYGDSKGIFTPWLEAVTTEAITVAESHQRKIVDERYASYQSLRVIDSEHVGEKIEEVEVNAYWYHHSSETKTDEENLLAEVYRIKGVDPSVAVCVKYLEPCDALTMTHYYTFVNVDVQFESLASLFSLYHAEEYFSVRGNALIDRMTKNEIDYKAYNLDTGEVDELGAMILSLDAEKCVLTEESFAKILDESKKQARIRFDLTSFGVVNYTMFITDGGYLLMTWCGENIYFDIGEEKANEIIDYIEKNGTVQVYDDNILITETTKR